jgi:hypothetical protein
MKKLALRARVFIHCFLVFGYPGETLALVVHILLSELRENVRLDEEMRDKDREKKEKMKGYADKRRNAKESNLSEGDKVLLKQQRINKWTTAFESQPYQLIDKN